MSSEETPPKIVDVAALSNPEWRDLALAKELLENPGLAARFAAVLGSPIERGFKMLPANWTGTLNKAVRSALFRALDVAVGTLSRKPQSISSQRWHKILVGASGGLGGAFGLAALPLELPVSTTIMLRSIADIARSEGHDLNDINTKLNCLEVFAFGGRGSSIAATESAYWAARTALSQTVAEATSYIARRGMIERTAPAVARFIAAISSRFGVIVSEEIAAKAVPIVGAAGGAVINVLFMDHFQNIARGHFIVRRLEKVHGLDAIRAAYNSILIPDKTL
ncbi:MAG: hypothetical protein JWM99_1263 [Verrucomicrobiales bacterium]|nr:hypothetical protein [Verrucomicrobiales bacterium]